MEKYYQEKFQSQDYLLQEKEAEIETLLFQIDLKN
jgi:hypothetical protein